MLNQTQTIVQKLLKQLEQGQLLPGHVLEEKSLVVEFDVSRTPVREALIQLEGQGLLQRKARGGSVVYQPTLEEFLAIFEVHAQLESLAAGLAARRIGVRQAVELEAACRQCEDFLDGAETAHPDDYYPLNLVFHKIVLAASHNDHLQGCVANAGYKLMAHYRLLYRFKDAIELSVKQHWQVAQAILDHDPEQAEQLMGEHMVMDTARVMDLITLQRQTA